MKEFEFHSPASVSEACKLLKKYSGKARALAGGTDLIPGMYHGTSAPEYIINLKRVPGLKDIQFEPTKGLTLGALVNFNDIIYSENVQKNYPILGEVSKKIASHQVRNLATLGGNLCNAAPSADSAPILIAYDSVVTITGPDDASRNLPLAEFFTGPGQTVLESGEILTHIHVPPEQQRIGMAYIKHSTRNALEIAVVGVAALIQLKGNSDVCSDARIVIAACAPTPLRVQSAEKCLIGNKLTTKQFESAANVAADAVKPISDVRACDLYRRDMVRVQCTRVLEEAHKRARVPEGDQLGGEE
jgi:carbon-monoxide dehydrogenase medium subunit